MLVTWENLGIQEFFASDPTAITSWELTYISFFVHPEALNYNLLISLINISSLCGLEQQKQQLLEQFPTAAEEACLTSASLSTLSKHGSSIAVILMELSC